MVFYERNNHPYSLSTDRGRLDYGMIHDFLANQSGWAEGILLPRLRRAIDHSIPFGLYEDENKQIGFARVLSDTSSLAYLFDVFVLEEYRGKGLGAWMMRCILEHPDLQSIKTWRLRSTDTRDFYAKFGFGDATRVEYIMEKVDPAGFKRL